MVAGGRAVKRSDAQGAARHDRRIGSSLDEKPRRALVTEERREVQRREAVARPRRHRLSVPFEELAETSYVSDGRRLEEIDRRSCGEQYLHHVGPVPIDGMGQSRDPVAVAGRRGPGLRGNELTKPFGVTFFDRLYDAGAVHRILRPFVRVTSRVKHGPLPSSRANRLQARRDVPADHRRDGLRARPHGPAGPTPRRDHRLADHRHREQRRRKVGLGHRRGAGRGGLAHVRAHDRHCSARRRSRSRARQRPGAGRARDGARARRRARGDVDLPAGRQRNR
jgi:hypothetical protein